MKNSFKKELYFIISILSFAVYSIVFMPGNFGLDVFAASLSGGNSDVGIYYIQDGIEVYDTEDANDSDAGDVQWPFAGGTFAYIGHATSTFDRMVFDVSGGGFFGLANDVAFQYWDGLTWRYIGTYTSSSHPFGDVGIDYLQFSPPADWTTTTVSTTEGYFIRVEATESVKGATVDQISIRRANAPTTTFSFAPTVTQDGSGNVSISAVVSDRDKDSDVRLSLLYDAGADCTTSTAVAGTIGSGTFGFNSLSLSVDNDDAEGYQINNIDTSSGAEESITTVWASGTDVPNAAGTYCIFLLANDDDYTGPYATTTVTLDNVSPTAPGDLAISATSTTNVTFTFPSTTSTDANFSEYKIHYKAGSSGVTATDETHDQVTDANLADGSFSGASTTTVGTAAFSELSTSTQYVAALYAYDSFGNTATSSEITFYTLAAAPTSTSGVADSTTAITVSWTASDNTASTEYYVEETSDATINSGWTTGSSYQITGLSASTEYNFRVKARNGDGIETAFVTTTAGITTNAVAVSVDNSSEESTNNNGGGGSPSFSGSGTIVLPSIVEESVDAGAESSAEFSGSQVSASMGPGGSVRFQTAGGSHTLSLRSLSGTRGSFTLQSDPIDFDLAVGEEAVFDVDGDGEHDVHVYMASVDGEDAEVKITNLEDYTVLINDGMMKTNAATIKVRVNPVAQLMHVAYSLNADFTGAVFETYTGDAKYLTFTDKTPGTKTVYVKLRDDRGATAVASDTIEYMPTAAANCGLQMQQAYKTTASNAVYYITEQCTKRAFTRSEIFFTYFNTWSDVKIASTGDIAKIPNDALGFMPWGPLYDPQFGALVKITSDPKVYLLLGGNKHWITDEAVFNALGYQWNWIEDIDPRLLNKYTTKGEITDKTKHPNYTLVKYEGDAKVYRLEPDGAKTVKRHIADEATFKALKYRWDRIVTIPTSEVYEDGAPLTQE
jgi:hypothetical protein